MERGRVEILTLTSEVLAGNPLGDPDRRKVHVYIPADGVTETTPCLLALAGFGGNGAGFFESGPFSPGLADRLDRLIGEGRCTPVLVAAPDCFTRLGGSQYLNSSAVGRYRDHLVDEVVPALRERFGGGRWGAFGKSSGGYGALRLALDRPDLFPAVADHAGDAHFELCYLGEWGRTLTAFRAAGGPAAWLEAMWADPNPGRGAFHGPLNMLAMAACYSPNPAEPHLGIDFPFDLETGEFRPEVWDRWREHDPVRIVANLPDAAPRPRYVYLDVGNSDEFHLQWGARTLAVSLKRAGVTVHFEEFDDGHFGTSYRFESSIPRLAEVLRTS